MEAMKRALVLCGGGSLGSYEIGAWRYLREKGLEFDIVTGTSIGAINGALVVSGEFEKAETLWKSVDASRVINNGINFYDRMWESFTRANFSRLMALAKDYVKFGGFDISPLIELMNQAIDPKKVLNSKTAFAVTTSTFPGFKQHNVDMKKVPEKEVMQWLLASSACYPIFPVRTINKKRYVDGGYNDNLPIDLALQMGADEVVAVLLHSIPKMPQHPELMDLPFVTAIRPTHEGGSIMNFSNSVVLNNMALGYLDARKTYGELWGRYFAFHIDESLEARFHNFLIEMAHENLLALSKTQEALTFEEIKPKTNRQIYIRTIELLGEWLGMDYLQVYEIDDFLNQALKKLHQDGAKPNIHEFLASHLFNKHISPNERRPFLSYLDYVYSNDLKRNKLQQMAETDPEIWAFMALFEQFKKAGLLN